MARIRGVERRSEPSTPHGESLPLLPLTLQMQELSLTARLPSTKGGEVRWMGGELTRVSVEAANHNRGAQVAGSGQRVPKGNKPRRILSLAIADQV